MLGLLSATVAAFGISLGALDKDAMHTLVDIFNGIYEGMYMQTGPGRAFVWLAVKLKDACRPPVLLACPSSLHPCPMKSRSHKRLINMGIHSTQFKNNKDS